MGAFWNPNGGLMVSGKNLSKKEVSLLKRKWSENPQFSTRRWQRWWRKIKMVATILFS
jgi:hypothetical protein